MAVQAASPSASTSVAPTCPTTTFGDDSISTSWPLKILTSMLPPDEMADELRQSGARWIGLDICRVIRRRRSGQVSGVAIGKWCHREMVSGTFLPEGRPLAAAVTASFAPLAYRAGRLQSSDLP